MGRPRRVDAGGYVYHVLNRGNARARIFDDDGDYAAFENVLREAVDRSAMRLLAYCLMPNHWHMVVWPERDGDLSRFVGWTTLTHTQRRHAHREEAGAGHLYQGRYKSFIVGDDRYFLAVARYVERNALRAGLVDRAEAWPWCSLWRRDHVGAADGGPPLADWPVPRPRHWHHLVNRPQSPSELAALRLSAARCRPYGRSDWIRRVAAQFDLDSTLRPPGRPRGSQ